ARSSGAFTRPRTGGPAFRQNDDVARAVLTFLRDPAGHRDPAVRPDPAGHRDPAVRPDPTDRRDLADTP
ncbi:hypothetical protein, partial [Streptomyces sp. SID3212]|uniref:hypothetical protein n=1 Tax=Streptomyces sp. SID3212 TaxID=2690259 RepID=UPI001F2AFEE5